MHNMISKFGQIFTPLSVAAAVSLLGSPSHAGSVNDVQLGATKYHKDWAVGCDNALTCEAVALTPTEFPEKILSLVISRTPGEDSDPVVNIDGFESESDRYRLFIDEELADTGAITDDVAPISVVGKDAMKLARAIAKGYNLRIIDGDGKELGRVSLAGSAAALKYLDARQGKARSQDAIAARGRKKPKYPDAMLPSIAAKRISDAAPIPETAALVELAESGACKNQRYGVTEDSAYSLGTFNGTPRVLALIGCGSGAYNFGSAAYIGALKSDGKWAFELAKFDFLHETAGEDADFNILINAAWDPETQALSSFIKGRGLGDCGQSADYVWDGEMFRLTHARVMDECRGSLDWITVWRAKVEFQDG